MSIQASWASAFALTTLALVLIIVNQQQISTCVAALSLKPRNPFEFYAGPGVLPSEILRARGYLAEDFHIQSNDGYSLRITRGRNPLINGGKGGFPGRVPILFIHGLFTSYNIWVINSFDAKPSVLTDINFIDTPLEELNARLGDLPSAKSLPLLAMDCGHEVFIMSRRGFPGSQKLRGDPKQGASGDENQKKGFGPITAFIGSLIQNSTELVQQIPFSFDREFWDFSIDEQVRYDAPCAVDFVREQTGWNQISLVGHSAGGYIALGALMRDPELNQKLSSVILWASCLSLGNGGLFNLLTPLEPLFRAYIGPVPPTFVTNPLEALLGLVCATELAQSTVCEAALDLALGYSGGQAPVKPEFINTVLYTSSSHELAHAMQIILLGGRVHMFSNTLVHPLQYDVGLISNRRLSFWVGSNDFTVSHRDVAATLPLLKVPYRHHLIDAFNHFGFFFHKNTSRLAIIPTLKEIHELSRL